VAKKEVIKLEIQANKLRELMELLKPAVPKKSTLPITAYIRLGEGKAIATDLETMVIAYLPEAEEPMLLPFASIAEMLKYVPGNVAIKIEAQNKKVSLAWSGGTASYPTEAIQDFPLLPEMPTKAEGLIDGDTLIPAMLAALSYTATETTRPVLNGVTLVLGNPIEIASGDGFRMSHQVLGLSFPLEEKIILPSHSVAILGHVFAKTPRTPPQGIESLIQAITAKRQLHIALTGENKVRVDFGRTASVVINLIQGSPPDWLQLIPREEPVLQSQLFAPQLEAAVRRVQSIAKDNKGIVRLVFNNGTVTVSSKGEDQEISATLDTMNTQGGPARTALDHRYLLDYLSGKQGIFIFSKYSDTGPVVLQYQNSPKVLIMPMFVQWDDEKPQTPEETKPEPEAIEEDHEPEPVETAKAKTPAKRNRKR
jgi:DNA polymerase III sliding clamp (beta) subunit (PCNA family)